MKAEFNDVNAVQGADYTNNKESIKMDFPTTLYNKVEQLFIDEKSKVFKKVLFIIYLINQGTWNKSQQRYNDYYELSQNRMKGYLSLNKLMTPILKKLVENKIIRKSGIGINGVNYTKYSMVERFDFKKISPSNHTPVYLTNADGVYVSKYINDDYIVKYAVNKKKNTQPKKEVNQPVIETETASNVIMVEELDKINMTLNELINKYSALESKLDVLENENKELREQLNNKADIASALKKEMAQHVNTAVNTRFEEPISDVNPDEVATDIIYDSIQDDKANTPFFSDDDIDFGEDLIKRVEALIMPEEDIDFSKVFISDDTSIEQPKVDINSLQSPIEKKLNTIIKRHIKPVAQIKMLSKFILANQEQEITAPMILNVGVGMSGATANRILNDLKLININ